MAERNNSSFMTTHWTALAALDGGDDVQRAEALRCLAERYWPPVYAFLRRQGLGSDEATDLTQAFFADVVLGRELFRRASPSRGRLRSLILNALRNFRIDEHRRRTARPDRVGTVECEERRLAMLDPAGRACSAEESFERRWALAIFDETLERCRRHFITTGRATHWQLFEARVLAPACSGNEPPPLAQIEATATIGGPAAASAALQVVRRRFENLLGEVVAETIGPDDALEEELSAVRRWLGDG